MTVDEVKMGNYFPVILEGTSDLSYQRQVSLVFQYFAVNSMEVKVTVLRFKIKLVKGCHILS
jgi:hypothetical protein